MFENALKCKYYNPNSFDLDFQPDISLCAYLHFNMRSLQGNFEKLRDILLLIKSSPDIISISETKIQNKTYTHCRKNEPLSNIALDGYQFYHVPSPTNAGGVVMYISNQLSHDAAEDFELKLTACEDMWFTIFSKTSEEKFLVGVVYRHPTQNYLKSQFVEAFNEILQKINSAKLKAFFVGDFNINTIKNTIKTSLVVALTNYKLSGNAFDL